MSRTTTALVVTSIGGPFELREVRLDSIRPDEALVEIHATGVCHTDLSSADGTLPGAPGAVLGHEGEKKSKRKTILGNFHTDVLSQL